jgi:hypothetical protein
VRDRAWLCLSRFVLFFILSLDVGTPIPLVPIVAPEPFVECVITLQEAFLLMNWSRSAVDFPVGVRERTHRV